MAISIQCVCHLLPLLPLPPYRTKNTIFTICIHTNWHVRPFLVSQYICKYIYVHIYVICIYIYQPKEVFFGRRKEVWWRQWWWCWSALRISLVLQLNGITRQSANQPFDRPTDHPTNQPQQLFISFVYCTLNKNLIVYHSLYYAHCRLAGCLLARSVDD